MTLNLDHESIRLMWCDNFADVQKSAVATVGYTVGFLGFGLFGGKPIIDDDSCGGGNRLSQDVIFCVVASLVLSWYSTFFVTPSITMFLRGLTLEDLKEKKMLKKIKSSFTLITVFLMVCILFMGLATMKFLEVRLGVWSCLSTRIRGLIIFIGYTTILIELYYLRMLALCVVSTPTLISRFWFWVQLKKSSLFS